MKYTLTVIIHRPLADVIELFDNPDNWARWRVGFVSAKSLMGQPGEAGSLTRLVIRAGGRRLVMTETVVSKQLPDDMTCIYEAPGRWFGAWNRVVNHFRPVDANRTAWEFESEFRCRGLLGLLSRLAPGIFRSASLGEMKAFKTFAENETGSFRAPR